MFRGFTQQDSQEFLRYFMDQLHEELREPVHSSHEDEESEMEGELSGGISQKGGKKKLINSGTHYPIGIHYKRV